MTRSPLELVTEFHLHLNAREPQHILDMASETIRVGGPRGVGEGKSLLAEWVERAQVTMTPRRTFHRDSTVVVEQLAEWRNAAGEVTSAQTVCTVFRIEQGMLTGISRYGQLEEALTRTGLELDDEVTRNEK